MNDFSENLSHALQDMYDRSATCDAGLLSPVAIDRGRPLLQNLGYPTALLDLLPQTSYERAFPLANPLAKIADLAPNTILDLGCGTALDIFFCAHLRSDIEHLTGIDASRELLNEGRKRFENFPDQAGKISLIEADLTFLENLNLARFDLILMNGSFNLIYDKAIFLQKLCEHLTVNGTVLIYDFILTESLPPGFADEIDNWLWNIGGALDENELSEAINSAKIKLISIKELERIDPVARCEILIGKE